MANNYTREPTVPPAQTLKIMTDMWHPSMRDHPDIWVQYAFPWGQPNTPLANYEGPRVWQLDELKRMSDFIGENLHLVDLGLAPKVYKSATTSGRGPGKSALVSWTTLWFMSCIPGATAILSANTDQQLTSKTFGEIGKWQTLCLSGYWFEKTQKKITPFEWFAKQLKHHRKIDDKYYYAEGVLWNEDNPDAFAGAHNDIGMLLVFDEASGIPQPIWTVSEGFFTEASVYRFWLAFSNPRRNTGAFFECFHAHRNYWYTRKIDSRNVEGLDKNTFDEIIKKYGEDSDEARIEVRGEFPSQGERQFISRSIVADARNRQLDKLDDHAALLMGVDPARYGDDSTVIRFRQGRDARSIPPTIMKGADNMMVANKCAELIDKHNPDGVFVDAGSGTGVIDRLKEMGYKVHEVWFGSASNEVEYADHRTELWAKMRDWLGGAMIDSSQDLHDDFVGPQYEFMGREDKLKLEPKEKMKKRGLSSPDHADALAVTFHAKIARKDINASRNNPKFKNRKAVGRDYKILG